MADIDGPGPRGNAPVAVVDAPAPAARPVPHRPDRSTLVTATLVCVIAASLAVVGWARLTAVPDGRTYSVVQPPPAAPDPSASPQPLVPLLPPGSTPGAQSRTAATRSRAAAPTARAPAAPARPAPVGTITGYAGKCLRVPDGTARDGIPVEMAGCDGSDSEQWTMASDGTIRAMGKCLEVNGDQAADGARVQLGACRGRPGQQWTAAAGRDLTNPSSRKCLDVKDFNLLDGAALQLWECVGGINQKWSVPA